jgi:hypothetical protein
MEIKSTKKTVSEMLLTGKERLALINAKMRAKGMKRIGADWNWDKVAEMLEAIHAGKIMTKEELEDKMDHAIDEMLEAIHAGKTKIRKTFCGDSYGLKKRDSNESKKDTTRL